MTGLEASPFLRLFLFLYHPFVCFTDTLWPEGQKGLSGPLEDIVFIEGSGGGSSLVELSQVRKLGRLCREA